MLCLKEDVEKNLILKEMETEFDNIDTKNKENDEVPEDDNLDDIEDDEE